MAKSDGKSYATKQELQETKQELLDKIDTRVSKEDFYREIKRLDGSIEMLANQVGNNTLGIKTLGGEVSSLRGEVYSLREEMNDRFGDMNDKFNTVLSALDGLAGQISDMHTEKAAGEHTFRRHEKKLDNHETRISALEQKAG
ncbi:MAG: hypothetical protein ACE5IR_05315 [bacterium]